MKLRFKLVTTFVSLFVMVALLFFGAYAALSPSVNMEGSISFISDNVYASVDIQNAVSAADSKNALTYTSAFSCTFDEESEENEFVKQMTLPKMNNNKTLSGYKIVITDLYEPANVGVGIKTITIPKVNNEYVSFASISLYINNNLLTQQNQDTLLSANFANGATTLVLELIVQITSVADAPASIS